MKDKILLFKEINDERSKFLGSYHDYWIEHALLTWQWWVLLITTILVWILWWKKAEKKESI